MDDTTRTAARACPLFAALSDSDLDAILGTADETRYPDQTCIFRTGDPETDLCIILEGRVRISQQSAGGEAKTLAILPTHASFGEMGLAAGLPRTADAFAVGNTTLLRLKQEALFALLESGSASAAKVMLALFRTVGPRMRQTNTELVSLYAAGRLMTTEPDVPLLLEGMLEVLMEATHARAGAVLLYNVTTDTLDWAAALGYDDPDSCLEWSEPYGTGGASLALERWETLVIADWNTDERTKALPVTGYERVTCLIVPLIGGDEPLGVFVLGDPVDEAGAYVPFRAADQILVEGIAAMTAAGIANARYLAEQQEQEKLQRKYIGG